MTFDDGILTVYMRSNTAQAGAMPVYERTFKASYYYGFDYLGFSRYYEALKAQVSLSHVVNVPDWIDIDSAADTVELEDGVNYRVAQVQKLWEQDGLKYTKLSLERITNDV